MGRATKESTSGGRILVSVVRNMQTACGAHPASMGAADENCLDASLTTHRRLVQKLRTLEHVSQILHCLHSLCRDSFTLLYEETNKRTFELYALFIDICMFRSPSATILRVYSIKDYNTKFVWLISPISDFVKCYKIQIFNRFATHITFYYTL